MQTVEYKGRLLVVEPEWYGECCDGCCLEGVEIDCKEVAEKIECSRNRVIARELQVKDVPHLDINKGEVNG